MEPDQAPDWTGREWTATVADFYEWLNEERRGDEEFGVASGTMAREDGPRGIRVDNRKLRKKRRR